MRTPKDNIPSVGKAMYEKIRAEMEAREWGRMVVINVNGGDYAETTGL